MFVILRGRSNLEIIAQDQSFATSQHDIWLAWNQCSGSTDITTSLFPATMDQRRFGHQVRGSISLRPESVAATFDNPQTAAAVARVGEFDFITNLDIGKPVRNDGKRCSTTSSRRASWLHATRIIRRRS
jgi:hypothetical protein